MKFSELYIQLNGWGNSTPKRVTLQKRLYFKTILCSWEDYTPASNLGYLAPPRTIFHGCQIVHWDPLDGKRRCPKKKNGLGCVKLHGFYANP